MRCRGTSSSARENTFCIYDAPSPEAIRKTAARSDLPVDRVAQVRNRGTPAMAWIIAALALYLIAVLITITVNEPIGRATGG